MILLGIRTYDFLCILFEREIMFTVFSILVWMWRKSGNFKWIECRWTNFKWFVIFKCSVFVFGKLITIFKSYLSYLLMCDLFIGRWMGVGVNSEKGRRLNKGEWWRYGLPMDSSSSTFLFIWKVVQHSIHLFGYQWIQTLQMSCNYRQANILNSWREMVL